MIVPRPYGRILSAAEAGLWRDAGEAREAAAREALGDLAGRHGVTVHVHPLAVAPVRAALSPWGDGARVVADEGMPRDACTLETEAGIVRAGLSDQLAILDAALHQAALCHA